MLEGVKMDFKKIYIIIRWPILRNISEVLSFLGFANFYGRFIKEYLKVAISLMSLIKKDFRWTQNIKAE